MLNKWPDNHHHYEVIVGNIGTVYSGMVKHIAEAQYDTCVSLSRLSTGKASGEDVTMLRDGDVVKEYLGYLTVGGDVADAEAGVP